MVQHRNHPLHWVEVWNGHYFEHRDLSQLGFVIYLGHGGHRCHNRATNSTSTAFVILHTNGVHHCKVEYCQCLGARPRTSQLMRADYFPATLERTETAFTFEILDDYILDSEISKKSAQDFLRRIVRRTCGAFPADVKVRVLHSLVTVRLCTSLLFCRIVMPISCLLHASIAIS